MQRTDGSYWQWVSGGGEADETPPEAAAREAFEETGLRGRLLELDVQTSIPVYHFAARPGWPADLYVIPEFAYALEVNSLDVVLSDEHSVLQWFNYDDALPLLHWQSNASALWELSERIRRSDFRSAGGGA